MTQGVQAHTDVSRHFKVCPRCRLLDPEAERTAYPGKRTISDGTMAAMCIDGRRIYRAYLRWLSEPE